MASISAVLAIIVTLALRAWCERSLPSPSRWSLVVRASCVLFVVYAPFSWLVTHQDSIEQRRALLALWPVFPGLIPVELAIAATVHKRLPAGVGMTLAVLVLVVAIWAALALMRRGWRWSISVAAILGAISSFCSFAANQLVRM